MGRKAGGETGIDDQYVARGFDGIGAWILGRNMFGPIRGPWPDESWHGWWGKNPPYHTPVFVLTRHARKPLRREGDTVFHFVTSGIQDALQQASAAAGGKDVRLGGGVATIRAYLHAAGCSCAASTSNAGESRPTRAMQLSFRCDPTAVLLRARPPAPRHRLA